jgi:hypothetical protein
MGKLKKPNKRKPPRKRRKFHPPLLAGLGYWATPVQKVVKRWRKKLGERVFESVIESYMISGVYSMTSFDAHINVDAFGTHKRFVLELLLALDDVWNDKGSLDGWILKLGYSGDSRDYENDVPIPRSYKRIQELIFQQSGLIFEEKAISKRAERLHLT